VTEPKLLPADISKLVQIFSKLADALKEKPKRKAAKKKVKSAK
jgi:hypothetical protein